MSDNDDIFMDSDKLLMDKDINSSIIKIEDILYNAHNLDSSAINMVVKQAALLHNVDQYDLRFAFCHRHNQKTPEEWYETLNKTSTNLAKCLNQIDLKISMVKNLNDVQQLIISAGIEFSVADSLIRVAFKRNYDMTIEEYWRRNVFSKQNIEHFANLAAINLGSQTSVYRADEYEDSSDDPWANWGASYQQENVQQKKAWKRLDELVKFVERFPLGRKLILKNENFRIK